jgi:hypothetical protein
MRDFLLTLLHLAVTAAKLCGPGALSELADPRAEYSPRRDITQ